MAYISPTCSRPVNEDGISGHAWCQKHDAGLISDAWNGDGPYEPFLIPCQCPCHLSPAQGKLFPNKEE